MNCLFSDELSKEANESDSVDQLSSDCGVVGANNQYWKMVEDRFESGPPWNQLLGQS